MTTTTTRTNDIYINEVETTPNPLIGLVEKLEVQKNLKHDLVVPAGHISYSADMGKLIIAGESNYSLTDHAHDQIGQKLEIPNSYYRRMKSEYPDLLAQNINGWLSRKEKMKYLLRTFKFPTEGQDHVCRAMLSNRYNILDNYDVLIAALEAVKSTGIHVEIVKAEMTDLRMYLHVVAPEIHVQATKLLDGYLENKKTARLNDGIISGFVISNSEVGMGTFEISARSQILVCKNGLHDRNAKFRKVHLGAAMDNGIIDWSKQTQQKNYELIVSQTKDAVKTYLSKEYLGNLISRLERYKEDTVDNPIQVVEKVSQELQVSESHKTNILKHFFSDGDNSVFGMMNAFTRETQNMPADTAHDVESGVFDLLPRIKSFDKQPASKN